MYLDNQELGRIGEELATKYLAQNKYKIIERNLWCKQGEIDIIAYDLRNKELVFFEVKTRSNFKYGRPSEAVTKVKKKHIVRAAEYYYNYKSQRNKPVRFDVIEIVFYKGKGMLNHIEKAILYES